MAEDDDARRTFDVVLLIVEPSQVRRRAELVARRLVDSGIPCEVVETEATVGGGAFPTARIASWAVSPDGPAEELEARLRRGPLPVIGRISEGRLLLDLRSVWPPDDAAAADAIRDALVTP